MHFTQSEWMKYMEIKTQTDMDISAIALIRGEMVRWASHCRSVWPNQRWFSSQFSNRGEDRLKHQRAQITKTVDGMPGRMAPR